MPKHWPACWSLDFPTLAEFRPHTGPPDILVIYLMVCSLEVMLDSFWIFRLIFSPALLWHILAMPDPCPLSSGRASTSLPVHHQHEHSRRPEMAALAETEEVSRRLHHPPAAPLGVEFHLAYGLELRLLTSLASTAVCPLRPVTR